MSSEQEQFITHQVHKAVATLTLNRPPLNVLSIPMLQQLADGLKSIEQEETRVLVLRAEGKMFSAGVDVADHTPEKVGEMIPLFNQVCQTLIEYPIPTIAVVSGHALGGGCELVLCCDLAVMGDSAKIGQPEIQLAAIAPIAALSLPRLVGYRAAADILFTGRNLSAQEALDMGMVNAVLPSEQIEVWVEEKTAQISGMSGAAQKINKKALRLGVEDWGKTLKEIEKIYLEELMSTADAKEGLEAFLEKRPPIWKHK
jgi:cyclohexa-1,5-dienecarbonyl-CoA hydratase